MQTYLLLNAWMDMAALVAGLRWCGTAPTLRMIPALMLGMLYAAACLVQNRLAGQEMQLLVLICMVLLAGRGRIPQRCRQIGAVLSISWLLGGACLWLQRFMPSLFARVLAASAVTAMSCLQKERRELRLTQPYVEVYASVRGEAACFEALIDTGNRVREPLSGMPVLIAEQELLEALLPLVKCRRVPFAGLGGSGSLRAFQPDVLRFRSGGKWRDAPGIWLAAYPQPMAGRVHALAPAAFALRWNTEGEETE